MLRNLSWESTDTLARSQFRIYQELGDAAQIAEEDRREALKLDQQEWSHWAEFLNEGPLPATPSLPEMLVRLGQASYRLAVLADGQGAAARA
ncbi:MAG TPA: hypothetical protein VMB73_19720 [Acetobacteraceae bacterium]|jgi:hypothetical protein|nr:hypothetical protein [Acetobacteraceae bacterium]